MAHGSSGGTSKIVFAFLLGAVTAYVILAVLPGGKDDLPVAAQGSTGLDYEVLETVNLLPSLDLDQYAPLVTQKHLTLKVLARQPKDTVVEGFKPFHFRRLVSEAKKIMARGEARIAEGTEVASEEGTGETTDSDASSGEGSAADEASSQSEGEANAGGGEKKEDRRTIPGAVHDNPRSTGRTSSGLRSLKAEMPGAAGGGTSPGRGASAAVGGPPKRTLPPQPTFAPPPPVPAVCESLQRSSELRKVWLTWKGKTRKQVNGTLPLGEAPDACKGVDIAENPPAIGPEHLDAKHPVTQAAAQGRFIKEGFTLEQVKELRYRGVSEQFYVDHELKLLYCVIPKAGCTTYKAWLLKSAGLYSGGNVHNRTRFQGPRVVNGQFISDEKLLEILNGGEYFKYTITRSPYTRVLATYLERFNKCETQMNEKNEKRRSKNECDMWKRALTGGNFPLPPDNATFAEYLRTMQKHKLNVVDFRNAHWVPGVQICGLDHIKYDWVGRLEDKADSELLYNFVGNPRFENKGLRHSENTAKKIPRFYTEETMRLVGELYKSTDVSRLGYIPDQSVVDAAQAHPEH